MRTLTLTILFLSLIGCNMLKGPKGDAGPAGPGTISVKTGIIANDIFGISDSRISTSNSMNVLVGPDGITWTEIPAYSPTSQTNAYYIMSNGSLVFYNCYSLGFVHYNIVFVTHASFSTMKDRLLSGD